MSTVIFDIDGTLADISHRVHLISGFPKDWKAFDEEAVNDAVIEPIASIFRMYKKNGYKIVIITSRMERKGVRASTEKWLNDNDLKPNALYMRKRGDYRQDYEVKADILADNNIDSSSVECVFEDRSQVVKVYRRLGFTCVQVTDEAPVFV